MARTAYFSPELFDFLRDLAKNNNREWFLRNKQRFESHVREPLQHFIVDFAAHLQLHARFAPEASEGVPS
jgi:uncharacterized protein (DUF2461 family)